MLLNSCVINYIHSTAFFHFHSSLEDYNPIPTLDKSLHGLHVTSLPRGQNPLTNLVYMMYPVFFSSFFFLNEIFSTTVLLIYQINNDVLPTIVYKFLGIE
jgi:hypothetical protein